MVQWIACFASGLRPPSYGTRRTEQCCSTLSIERHRKYRFEASEGGGEAILSDCVGLIEAKDIVAETPQSGEDAGIFSDARGVFAQGDVARVVGFVLDSPVVANRVRGDVGFDGAAG